VELPVELEQRPIVLDRLGELAGLYPQPIR
jgi:hypothetical protein